jgi:hypothetical protein
LERLVRHLLGTRLGLCHAGNAQGGQRKNGHCPHLEVSIAIADIATD